MRPRARIHARALALGVAAALLCGAGVAAAKSKKKPPQGQKPPKPPPQAQAKPTSNSYWEPLVTAGGRWTLLSSHADHKGTFILVEVYDARGLKGHKDVRVARLRWSVRSGNGLSPMGNSLPTQIALTKKGAYLLSERLDDEAVAKAIKGKPSFADPPKTFTSDDGYVRKDGDQICIGIGTPPTKEKSCVTGVCHAEYCLGKGVGVTSMSGNFTPDAADFKAPAQGSIDAALSTGIPECDRAIGAFWSCIQTSPQIDETQRKQFFEQFRQFADVMRQQATTPQGRQAAVEQCVQFESMLPDYRVALGCGMP